MKWSFFSLALYLLAGAAAGAAALDQSVSNGDYTVKATAEAVEMSWRDQPFSRLSHPSIVEGPGWKQTLAGDRFWSGATVSTADGKLTARREADGCTVVVTLEPQERGIELTFRFDTAATPLEDAGFWFAALTPEWCTGTRYRLEDQTHEHLMPPEIARETEPKSRWRISEDIRKLTLFSDGTTMTVSGDTPFYLFDGRFHNYFRPEAQSVSLTTAGKLTPGKTYRFFVTLEPGIRTEVCSASQRHIAVAKRLATPPEIDGALTDAGWREIPAQPLQLLKKQAPNAMARPEEPTEVWLGYDDDKLYVAFRCHDRRAFALRDLPRPRELYEDECVEVFLNTENGVSYKQILLSIKDLLQINYVGARPLYELAADAVAHAVQITSDGWNAELSIPLQSLGLTAADLPKIDVNFARERQNKPEYSTFAALESSFHEPHNFARFLPTECAADALNPSGEVELSPGSGSLAIRCANSTSQVFEGVPIVRFGVDGQIRDCPAIAPISLAPGAFATVVIPVTSTPEDSQMQILWRDAQGVLLASSRPYYLARLNVMEELENASGRLEALRVLLPEGVADGLRAEAIALSEAYRPAAGTDAGNALREEAISLLNTVDRLELAAAQNRVEALRSGLDFYSRSSLEKIFQAEKIASDVILGTPLRLTAAGDESANIQLVVLPLWREFPELALSVTDLISSSGAQIPSDRLQLYKITDLSVGGKPWPDRLQSVTPAPLKLKDHQSAYWLRVSVPPGTPAGLYRGHVRLGDQTTVPLEVTVLPWDLPRLPYTFAWMSYSLDQFPDRRNAEKLARMLMEYDLYPSEGPSHPRYLDETLYGLDALSGEKLKRFGMLNLAMYPWLEWLQELYTGRYAGDPTAFYAKVSEQVRAGVKALRASGENSPLYIYYDEINSEQLEIKEMLAALKSELQVKVITCFCTPALGKEKVAYYEDLVDLYFFSDGYFTDPALLEYIQSLRAKGRKIGWYFNLSYPKFPTSNCIDAPGVANRIQFFAQWKYQVDISLFWGANCWWTTDWTTDPVAIKNRGDGVLVYPDREWGFVPSIRLELLREGAQDYRALAWLQKLVDEAQRAGKPLDPAFSDEVAEILRVDWLVSVTDYPESSEQLLRQRSRVNQAIARLLKLLQEQP